MGGWTLEKTRRVMTNKRNAQSLKRQILTKLQILSLQNYRFGQLLKKTRETSENSTHHK
jgi:hypothetical protein